MLCFLVFGVEWACAELDRVGVYKCVGGGGVVVHLSAWMDNAFLPLGRLLMDAALCGVGENWTVQIWRGHGLDADGG